MGELGFAFLVQWRIAHFFVYPSSKVRILLSFKPEKVVKSVWGDFSHFLTHNRHFLDFSRRLRLFVFELGIPSLVKILESMLSLVGTHH